jgi:hypothetical protein
MTRVGGRRQKVDQLRRDRPRHRRPGIALRKWRRRRKQAPRQEHRSSEFAKAGREDSALQGSRSCMQSFVRVIRCGSGGETG